MLEGIDPRNQSLYTVLSVSEVKGHRIRLHFEGIFYLLLYLLGYLFLYLLGYLFQYLLMFFCILSSPYPSISSLSFLGYSPMFDFWMPFYSPFIFPVGWCKAHNKVLQPPKCELELPNIHFSTHSYILILILILMKVQLANISNKIFFSLESTRISVGCLPTRKALGLCSYLGFLYNSSAIEWQCVRWVWTWHEVRSCWPKQSCPL